MRGLLSLLLLIFAINANAQNQTVPNIYSEIQDTNYNDTDFGFLYTISSVLPAFGLPPFHKAAYGAVRLENGNHVFEGVVNPVDTFGQPVSLSQAFQQFDDQSYSLYAVGGEQAGYVTYDSEFNPLLNFWDLGIMPDAHGISKLSDGRFAYFEGVYDSINFYNPPHVMDSATHRVLGHNVNIFDTRDSSVTTIFKWFEDVSYTMMVPEYIYEGNAAPGVIDWDHPNWIHEDYDGNLLISHRHAGFLKINVDTGDVMWWGGLPTGMASDNGFPELTCVEGDCRTRLQHSFKPIDGKNGQYTIFDNGDDERDSSRALFLQIDGASLEVEVTAQYMFEPSPFMGSVSVHDNGNFLVNVPSLRLVSLDTIASWAQQGVLQDSIGSYLATAGSRLYFVEPDGSIISRYWTDSLNFIYTAQLVDYSEWPVPVCNGNNVELSSEVTNPVWSNGMTGPEIVADGDTVDVMFDFGIAVGYTRPFDTGPCLTTDIPLSKLNPQHIYPNPASEIISIENYIGLVNIYDIHGQKVLSDYSINGQVDVRQLRNGLYILVGHSFTSRFVKI